MVSKNIYKCYSVGLKKFLLNQGLEYFNVGISTKKMTYWEFAKTPKFKKALDEWDKLNKC